MDSSLEYTYYILHITYYILDAYLLLAPVFKGGAIDLNQVTTTLRHDASYLFLGHRPGGLFLCIERTPSRTKAD